MPSKTSESIDTAAGGLPAFFAWACALTWSLAAPMAWSLSQRRTPPPYAVACAALSAFGPLLAALLVAGPRRQLAGVFGRWRAHVGWIVVALLAPAAVQLLGQGLYAGGGGNPAQWLYPPTVPAQWAALVVFPLGEEFGWRGFAHPRMVRRFGVVRGSLLLGLGWGLWHAMYTFSPLTGAFNPLGLGLLVVELPLYSLVVAWILARTNGSMAVALAFHAGAHLDNFQHASRSDLGLQALHLVGLVVVAFAAGRFRKSPAVSSRPRSSADPSREELEGH